MAFPPFFLHHLWKKVGSSLWSQVNRPDLMTKGGYYQVVGLQSSYEASACHKGL